MVRHQDVREEDPVAPLHVLVQQHQEDAALEVVTDPNGHMLELFEPLYRPFIDASPTA